MVSRIWPMDCPERSQDSGAAVSAMNVVTLVSAISEVEAHPGGRHRPRTCSAMRFLVQSRPDVTPHCERSAANAPPGDTAPSRLPMMTPLSPLMLNGWGFWRTVPVVPSDMSQPRGTIESKRLPMPLAITCPSVLGSAPGIMPTSNVSMVPTHSTLDQSNTGLPSTSAAAHTATYCPRVIWFGTTWGTRWPGSALRVRSRRKVACPLDPAIWPPPIGIRRLS